MTRSILPPSAKASGVRMNHVRDVSSETTVIDGLCYLPPSTSAGTYSFRKCTHLLHSAANEAQSYPEGGVTIACARCLHAIVTGRVYVSLI
jgi:hypothetical protein